MHRVECQFYSIHSAGVAYMYLQFQGSESIDAFDGSNRFQSKGIGSILHELYKHIHV